MGTKKEKPTTSPEQAKEPMSRVVEDGNEDELVRFSLILLRTERERMSALQGECRRQYAVLNSSEVLRAGIGALERLLILSPEDFKEVIENVRQL